MTKIEISLEDEDSIALIDNILTYFDEVDVNTYKIRVSEPNSLASWGYEKLKHYITTQFTET